MFVHLTELKNLIIDADNIGEYFYKNTEYIKFFKENLQTLKVIILYKNLWYKNYYENLDIHNSFIYIETKSSFFSITFLYDLDINLYESAIITGSQEIVRTVHNYYISTILLTRDLSNMEHTALPDYIVTESKNLSLILTKSNYGFYNEMVAEDLNGTGYIYNLGEIRHSLFPEISASLLAGGRYFTSRDHRAYTHCLTNKILKLKECNPVITDQLACILKQNLQVAKNFWGNIDFITNVPPKPTGNNHLGFLLGNNNLNEYRGLIDTNILYTTRDYPKQRTVGSWENRAINVLNAFASRKKVNGHVIIVDDILTSGSTTLECAKVLYESGAEKVSIVPLAVMQSQSNTQNPNKISCPNCTEGIFKLRFNNQSGASFWACDQFPRCNTTGDYFRIKKKYNLQYTLDKETLF
jgi:ssDNA-binding Zn-finger/Zn-ribbon topoisomerase 1